MVLIKTKSLQARKNSRDGLRICIMRRIRPEYNFDMWLPAVSPNEQLLQAYVINKSMQWDEFKPLFLSELKKNSQYLEIIYYLAKKGIVTLLCSEDSPDECHRSLVAKEIKKLYPTTRVIIR